MRSRGFHGTAPHIVGCCEARFVRIIETELEMSTRQHRQQSGRAKAAGLRQIKDLDRVYERACEVFGDETEAARWLGTPVRALAYATPVSLLASNAGAREVLTVLDRLEHGVL